MGAAAVGVLLLFGSQAVLLAVIGVERTHPEQATFLYDVAALSVRRDEVLFSSEVYPRQDLAALEQGFIRGGVNPLIFGGSAPLPFPLTAEEATTLRQDWLDAIAADPVGYLAVRWSLWEQQMAWSGKTEWVYHPYVDPNPWGYQIAHPSLDERLQAYLRLANDDSMRGGPVYEVWVYMLVTALGVLYLRHRSPERQLVGWLCVASLVYQVTIFAAAMGVGYRLTYPSVVLALAVILIALADARVVLRRAMGERRRRDGTTRSAPPDVGRSGGQSGPGRSTDGSWRQLSRRRSASPRPTRDRISRMLLGSASAEGGC
jgi:hypothetical protein